MALTFRNRVWQRGASALERLVEVVQAEEEPACVIDRRGVVVVANPPLIELLGLGDDGLTPRLGYLASGPFELEVVTALFEKQHQRHRGTVRCTNQRTHEPLWLKWDFSASADGRGRTSHAVALVEDQTGRINADSHVRILQYLITAAARAKDSQDLLYAAAQVLCHFTGCGLGQVWLPDGDWLVCSPVHYAHGYELEHIRRESLGARLRAGQGITGLAWSTGETEVAIPGEDLVEEDRAETLARAGVSEVVAVPIRTSTGVAAVLEMFVSRDRAPIDRAALIAKVGVELGELLERRLLNDALRASEERFRAVSESAVDAIVSADGAGRVVSWNKGAEKMFGWASHEMVGRSLTVIIPERLRAMHNAGIARVAAGAPSTLAGTVVELVALRRDGSEFPVELAIGMFEGVDGRGFSAVLRDISERKAAEQALRASQERFRAVSESAVDAIVSADSAGRVVSWNKGAEAMFGWSTTEMVGHPLTVIIPERLRAMHNAGIARVAAGAPSTLAGTVVELVALRRDGSEFPVELAIGMFEGVDGLGFSAVLRDITERKAAEEAVALASREVERTNAELETLIYSASHDLKSPMVSVLGYLEYLKVDYGQMLGVEGERYLERMTDCTLYMQRLIQDLIELSQVGRRRGEPEPLDLAVLVGRIIDEVGASHPDTTFSASDLPVVLGDPVAFRQLFTNLIENAVQHGDRRDLAVEVTARSLPGGGAEISVRDNGQGIPDQYRELVFGVFERLDGSRAGTGMGLAICRKITEQFGGTISITGTKGTDVRIVVPPSMVRHAAAAPATLAAAPRSLGPTPGGAEIIDLTTRTSEVPA